MSDPEEMYNTNMQVIEEQREGAVGMPVRTIGEASLRWTRLQEFRQKYMISGVDFGPAFPGSDKDVLLKPGAEKLAWLFGLRPEYEALTIVEDWTGDQIGGGEPLFFYRYRCDLYDIGSGTLIGSGIGSVNSWETKYRSRWVDADEWEQLGQPPFTAKEVGTTKLWGFAYQKRETTGRYARTEEEWEAIDAGIENGTVTLTQEVPHWDKKNRMQDVYLIPVTRYKVSNPQVYEQVNTFDKMAQKRSFMAAVLVATGASAYFTQDIEEWAGYKTQSWTPSWGEFYHQVLQPGVLDTLFSTDLPFEERVGLLAEYIKNKHNVTSWQPQNAAALKIELLVDQRLKEREE